MEKDVLTIKIETFTIINKGVEKMSVFTIVFCVIIFVVYLLDNLRVNLVTICLLGTASAH